MDAFRRVGRGGWRRKLCFRFALPRPTLPAKIVVEAREKGIAEGGGPNGVTQCGHVGTHTLGGRKWAPSDDTDVIHESDEGGNRLERIRARRLALGPCVTVKKECAVGVDAKREERRVYENKASEKCRVRDDQPVRAVNLMPTDLGKDIAAVKTMYGRVYIRTSEHSAIARNRFDRHRPFKILPAPHQLAIRTDILPGRRVFSERLALLPDQRRAAVGEDCIRVLFEYCDGPLEEVRRVAIIVSGEAEVTTLRQLEHAV